MAFRIWSSENDILALIIEILYLKQNFFETDGSLLQKEDQSLRLLSNFLFYHFNRSEPTYKFQRIKLLDVIAACNQLNENAIN